MISFIILGIFGIFGILGLIGLAGKVYIDHADSADVAGWVEIGWPFFPRLAAAMRSEISIRDALEIAESRVRLWSDPFTRCDLDEPHIIQMYKRELQKAQLCLSELKEILACKVSK